MLPEPPAPTRSQPSPRQAHRAEFSMRKRAPHRGAGEPPPGSSDLSYCTQDLGSEGKCCHEARTNLGNPLGPHLTGAALAHPDMGLAARYLASRLRTAHLPPGLPAPTCTPTTSWPPNSDL